MGENTLIATHTHYDYKNSVKQIPLHFNINFLLNNVDLYFHSN